MEPKSPPLECGGGFGGFGGFGGDGWFPGVWAVGSLYRENSSG